MSHAPMDRLAEALGSHALVRFFNHYERQFPDAHLKDLVLDALGSYDNALVVGSLSKGFSCFGGFVGCPAGFKKLLKIRSNTFIFGGPVPPAYLEAVCVAVDILQSPEYDAIRGRLSANLDRLVDGCRAMDLVVLGGVTPIVSILVGDEDLTLAAGRMLFDDGFYVQSVTFPAVPYHAGVLRIQVNANHAVSAIDSLVAALGRIADRMELPRASNAAPPPVRRAA